MKRKLMLMAGRYLAELRKHLKAVPGASSQPALRIGGQAVALGLDTLDLARMHEQALVVLALSKRENGLRKRAEIFFTEALTPIIETHQAARQGKISLTRANEALIRRTVELAATHRRLQRRIARHKVKEAAFKKNGKAHDKSLRESLQLQKQLRQLTHQVLAAQEGERKTISLELQNEIAQTLMGVNVQLLCLKQEARGATAGFKNKIAQTQHSVVSLAKSVRRFARELDMGPAAS